MGMSKKSEEEKRRCLDKSTPAQVAFEKMQKWQMERILEKAFKTHKQRVEDFNGYLDTLTEHYDSNLPLAQKTGQVGCVVHLSVSLECFTPAWYILLRPDFLKLD